MRDNPPADRFPRDVDSDRDDDLETLFVRHPPRPVDPRTVDRLTERAMGRLRRRRFLTHRARRRMVMVVAALASAAALVILARWPWQEGATPNDAPAVADRQITERQISERPGPVDSEPEAATKTGATPD